ncbi:MAG: rhodanese-like domain-containing protein [Archangiaceae bacterium]|nr:rhodanese-like domain-containing protein [Archangiaceae bacterium]
MRGAVSFVVMSLLVAPHVAAGAPKVDRIMPKVAAALVEKGAATLVDVREAEELSSGMARPAKWFSFSKTMNDPAAFKDFLAKLPRGKVIFYCVAGARAGKVAEQAAALGYAVASMGLSEWRAAGLPTREKP